MNLEPESDRLIWMDLEMSGLDPDRERILEIAVLVTGYDLRVLAEGPDLVIRQPARFLAGMDEWNRTHHGDSGLTERVRTSSVSETDAERAILDFLSAYCAPGDCPLAGNTVHQDRRFLVRYMPQLSEFLHYRNVDVSTVKELVQRWNPQAFAGRPPKREAHRAMEDIRESIAELRYYRESAFR